MGLDDKIGSINMFTKHHHRPRYTSRVTTPRPQHASAYGVSLSTFRKQSQHGSTGVNHRDDIDDAQPGDD
eukprot:1355043-Amphidinium_carterae.6